MFSLEAAREEIKTLKTKALHNYDFVLYLYILFNEARYHLNFIEELMAYMFIYDFIYGDRRYIDEEMALYDYLEMSDFDEDDDYDEEE